MEISMTLPLPQPQENRFHALEELVHENHMTTAARKSKRSNKVKTIWARRLAACPPPPLQKKKQKEKKLYTGTLKFTSRFPSVFFFWSSDGFDGLNIG